MELIDVNIRAGILKFTGPYTVQKTKRAAVSVRVPLCVDLSARHKHKL